MANMIFLPRGTAPDMRQVLSVDDVATRSRRRVALAPKHGNVLLHDLPEALIELAVVTGVTFEDVAARAACCRLWQGFMSEQWQRLTCERFDMVRVMSAKGQVPTTSWATVAREHARVIQVTSGAPQTPELVGGKRALGRHKPKTTLDEYVFHVVLSYGTRHLGEWSGSFATAEQMSKDDGFYGDGFESNDSRAFESATIRLWTEETAPWVRDPELDVPVDAEDPPEQWDLLYMHIFAGRNYRTRKIYAGPFEGGGLLFDVKPLLWLPKRMGRSQLNEEQVPDIVDSYSLMPCIVTAASDGEAKVFWEVESRVALKLFLHEADTSAIRLATAHEAHSLLERLLVSGAQVGLTEFEGEGYLGLDLNNLSDQQKEWLATGPNANVI